MVKFRLSLEKELTTTTSDTPFDHSFDEHFNKFLPIVYKSIQNYKINLWETSDYIQEAMLIFYELKNTGCPEESLPVYFKVKFNQHLINLIRKQNAYKRKFDTGNYVNLDVIVSQVADESYAIGSQLLVTDTMASFLAQLKKNDRILLLRLIDGKMISRSQKSRLKQKLLKFLEKDGNE
ncbi:MAG: sigma-70 family RNA polymerase sigma factor [Streptococcaceae bacterium]|nr:sigma-70 family RNA polymerase sigma factor [Streptococcaceae bacterium]